MNQTNRTPDVWQSATCAFIFVLASFRVVVARAVLVFTAFVITLDHAASAHARSGC
jgi:hypothetical protein